MGAVYLAETRTSSSGSPSRYSRRGGASGDSKRFNRMPSHSRTRTRTSSASSSSATRRWPVYGHGVRTPPRHPEGSPRGAAIAIMRQSPRPAEAHDSIVHRDLKPDNIMLMNFRKVREFKRKSTSASRRSRRTRSSRRSSRNTASCMAPSTSRPSKRRPRSSTAARTSTRWASSSTRWSPGSCPSSPAPPSPSSAHVYDEPKAPVALTRCTPRWTPSSARRSQRTPQRYQTAVGSSRTSNLEQELVGETATKTTILDASQLSSLEVSKQAQQRREQADVLAARSR